MPDIAQEAFRRNKLFKDRFELYSAWQNGEKRTQEAFIMQAINSIIRQKPERKKYIEVSKFEECRKTNSDNYRKYFFPVHYAIEDLISWLDSSVFKELLLDYQMGSEGERIEGVRIYHESVRKIQRIEKGAQYLSKVYDDPEGFLNKNIHFIALKEKYSDTGFKSNVYSWIRKWDNVVFGFIEEMAPILAAKEKSAAIAIISNIVLVFTGKALETVKVKPVTWSAMVVEVADVQTFLKRLGTFSDKKVGKSIVSLIEARNVAFAVVGVCDASTNEERIKNIVNLLGAIVDLSSNCWLTKQVVNKNKTVLPALGMVSGIIDCVVGIWQAKDEWKSGDIDSSLGWATFALGGLIISVGFFIKMTGIKATAVTAVPSGGASTVPGAVVITVGLVVEGIGLAVVFFCNNDEIEDWLTQSTFGTKPQGNALKQQIQDLNDILCKFEVEARFEDVQEKFNNRTYATIIVKPRAISERSKITFSNMRALAYDRISEYILGNRHDLVTGMAGSENPVLDLANPSNCKIIREKERITQIETTLCYGMDIDEITGTAKLEVGNGTLQGYTKNFVVKA